MRKISGELVQIPEEYLVPMEHGGHVEKLVYQTYESMTYEKKEKILTKTAYVYLPADYTPQKQYNIFYMMHGGWSNETTYLGTDTEPKVWANILDHAIADGKMKPFIVVCPTYNNESPEDSANKALALVLNDNYHHELIHDLIPAVEGKYHTYALGTDRDSLRASREHRLFGGFSMGGVATWRTFEHCTDCFSYFMPSSGDLTDDGELMNRMAVNSGYGRDDFFIYTATGTDDFDYQKFTTQIEAMLAVKDSMFVRATAEQEGNLSFLIQEGAVHNYDAAMQYIYNGLLHYFECFKNE